MDDVRAVGAAAAGVRRIVFTAHGLPVPQGSKSAIRQGGRTLVVERGRAALNPWRQLLAAAAAAELDEPFVGPVSVWLTFALPRPKSHYGSGRNAGELRPSAPVHVAGRPDVDKLARAVLDALTGVAFRDDGQVAELRATKRYAASAGVVVDLMELDP